MEEKSGKKGVGKELDEYDRKFKRLSKIAQQELSKTAPGEYEIEVAEILTVGMHMSYLSEVAIVKDTEGRTWAIPEDGSSGENRLVSRWSVRAGMKLKVEVAEESGEKFISGVLVQKPSA